MPFHVFEIDEPSLERQQALFSNKRKIEERVELNSMVGTY